MAFVFGQVDYLNATTTVVCFMLVIAFVVVVDYILGVTEHLLADNPIYDRIFRILYKELMMMGLITFLVIMLEALYEGASHEFYVSIDFAHILVFFQTLFFAFFAVLLIRMSFVYAKKYRQSAKHSVSDLLSQYKQYYTTCFGRFLLSRRYIPFLSIVRTTEYKVLEKLFTSHYFVPDNFDFGAYLSGCFTRFALKAVNRSLITWFVLAVLFVLNFARLRTNLSCAREQTSSEGHRMLYELDGGLDTMIHLAGGGGGSSTHATDDHHETGKSLHECRVQSLRYFLLGGVVLIGYTLMLLIVSRIYKLRLLHFAGVDNAMDYKAFLEYSERFPEDEKKVYNKRYQLSEDELRNVLRANVEAFEDEEDEEGFKFLATLLVKTTSTMNRKVNTWSMETRIFFTRLFCPSKLAAISEEERFMVKDEADPASGGVRMSPVPGSPAGSPMKPSTSMMMRKAQSMRYNPATGAPAASILDEPQTPGGSNDSGTAAADGSPASASSSPVKNASLKQAQRLYLPSKASNNAMSTSFAASSGSTLNNLSLYDAASSSPGKLTRRRIEERIANMAPAADGRVGGGHHADVYHLPHRNHHHHHHGGGGHHSAGHNAAGGSHHGHHHAGAHHPSGGHDNSHHHPQNTEALSAQELLLDILAVRRAVASTVYHHHHNPQQQPEATAEATTTTTTTTTTMETAQTRAATTAAAAAAAAAEDDDDVAPSAVPPKGESRASFLSSLGSSMFQSASIKLSTTATAATSSSDATTHKPKPHRRSTHVLRPRNLKKDATRPPRSDHAADDDADVDADDDSVLRLPSYFLVGFHRYQLQKRQYQEELPSIRQSHKNKTLQGSPHPLSVLAAPPALSAAELHAQVLQDVQAVYLRPDGEDLCGHRSAPSHTEAELHPREFSSVYLLRSPAWYFHMVELCVMFTCLYMAVWITNMVTVTEVAGMPYSWEVLTQLGLCIPFFFVMVVLPSIVEICSMLEAMTSPNPHAMLKVLEDTQDRQEVVARVQRRMLQSIARRIREEISDEDIVRRIFMELDADGSGALDYAEIEHILLKLNIKLDFRHFRLLMRELQGYEADGRITEASLCHFLFPPQSLTASEDHLQRLRQELAQHEAAMHQLQQEIASTEKHLHARKVSMMMTMADTLSRMNDFDDV